MFYEIKDSDSKLTVEFVELDGNPYTKIAISQPYAMEPMFILLGGFQTAIFSRAMSRLDRAFKDKLTEMREREK